MCKWVCGVYVCVWENAGWVGNSKLGRAGDGQLLSSRVESSKQGRSNRLLLAIMLAVEVVVMPRRQGEGRNRETDMNRDREGDRGITDESMSE